MTQHEKFVGIDVSGRELVVAWGSDRFAVANTAAGHDELIARFRHRPIAAIGLEASGGYERPAAKALRQAGLPVRVVDSWRVHQFAKAMASHAKTDPGDAAVIARFIEIVPAEPILEPEPLNDELVRLVAYREALVADKVRLVNQKAQLDDDALLAMTVRRLELLRSHLKRLERRIRTAIRADKTLRRKMTILTSAPGVGFVNAITLMAKLPELGHRSPKKIAALVGLAPYDNKSGTSDKGAHITRGRPVPRSMLYLAVLNQLRRCQWAKDFRDTLTAKGKPKMVAVVALMRRLIVALNAMIKQDRPWHDPVTP